MVSDDGKDDLTCLMKEQNTSCKTISYAMKQRATDICLGYFEPNQIMHISDEHAGNIRLYGKQFSCQNCTIIIGRVASTVQLININFYRNIIQVTDNVIIIISSVLSDVSISNLLDDRDSTEVSIHLLQSVLKCENNNNGIIFESPIVLKLNIVRSYIINCPLKLSIKALLLVIYDSFLTDTTIDVNITSSLKVPSKIHLQNTSFENTISNETKGIDFLLFNPLIEIIDCNFINSPISLRAKTHIYQEQLFDLSVKGTYFLNGTVEGNGGALMVSSNVIPSNVVIYNCYFVHNSALIGEDSDSGQGGAIYLEGEFLIVVIDKSVFENNVAQSIGTSVYADVGVSLYISNVVFQYDIKATDHILPSILSCQGKVRKLTGLVNVSNKWPEYYTFAVDILSTEVAMDIELAITCPTWYHHEPAYTKTDVHIKGELNDLGYRCIPCPETYYALSQGENIIHNRALENNSASNAVISHSNTLTEICKNCPYGALCSGNNVLPRPNYWGYWYEKELIFQQCPTGYCCDGSQNAPCKSFNFCANNRSGDLCGMCQEGFSVAILTGLCLPNNVCGSNHWFWVLAVLAPLGYALWYILKDDILSLIWSVPNYLIQSLTGQKPITDNSNDQNSDVEDKGYFGIVTYYVQMNSIMRITVEFNETNQSTSVLDLISIYINRALNFELSEISFNFCPIPGLTIRGKHLYKMIFLLAIFVSWAVLFTVVMIIRKCHFSLNRQMYIKQFYIKLVKGIAEIMKYTYVGFCGAIFMSLVCVRLKDGYVWWYDASHICLQKWQFAMVLFGTVYALPFPLTLYLGLKHLAEKQINSWVFVMCCLCPLGPLLVFCVAAKYFKRTSPSRESPLSEVSTAMLSVMQGPYRQDPDHMTLYWESVVCVRRLLISGLILLSYESIRMSIILALMLYSSSTIFTDIHFKQRHQIMWNHCH